MSILGKVLIVLNLLAAAAFTYVTLNNWHTRKDLTRAAVVRYIQLNGIPVDSQPPASGLDSDAAPFKADIYGTPYEQLPKATIAAAIPKGDEDFGGEAVYDQTAEVKRVQKKVFDNIAAKGGNDANLKFQWLRAYLVAVTRTGAQRDGANAIFDMRDQTRAYAARRDLPLAARTESQVAALRALVDVADLGDPQAIPEAYRAPRIAQTRDAIKRFALGEVPYGAGADEEARRRLTNAVLGAFGEGAAGAAQQQAIDAAATDAAYKHVSAVAVESLFDRASADRAAAELLAYATARANTPGETGALKAIASMIRPAPQGFNLDAEVDAAGSGLLNAKFEEAALPAATKSAANGDPAGEKARKIAHLLYHVDGWRYADNTAVAARQAWHQRVAAVVGLPEYIRAAETEATEYAEAAQRLTASITDEQSAFEAAYQSQLQRNLFIYSQWLALDAQVKAQNAITDENVRLMNERRTERDNLLKELAQARADAKSTLDRLTKTQADLFAIQKQLRDAQEALLVLEKQLEHLESQVVNQATRK